MTLEQLFVEVGRLKDKTLWLCDQTYADSRASVTDNLRLTNQHISRWLWETTQKLTHIQNEIIITSTGIVRNNDERDAFSKSWLDKGK